jgi:hypothetical protein
VSSIEYYMQQVQLELEASGHRVRWLMTGSSLAHGVCDRCSETVVVERGQGMQRIICEVLDRACQGPKAF